MSKVFFEKNALKGGAYCSPQCEILEVDAVSTICASSGSLTIDPWGTFDPGLNF